MAILWLQVLPADEKDAEELKRSVGRTFLGAFAGGEISSGLGARIGGGILDRVLKGLDADGDGVLSAAEEAKLAGGFEKLSARAGEQLKPLLRQLDADGNGKLDAAEIEKLRQRLKEASKAK
ncbi:MAG: hypothetical protein M5U26_04255 [Planctomycetota bacterium]|nr:hypothetical protein [Planctomycetota bacterium]